MALQNNIEKTYTGTCMTSQFLPDRKSEIELVNDLVHLLTKKILQ